jgi:hypothetical protein
MATVEAAMQANKFAKGLQKKLRQLQELEAKAGAGTPLRGGQGGQARSKSVFLLLSPATAQRRSQATLPTGPNATGETIQGNVPSFTDGEFAPRTDRSR